MIEQATYLRRREAAAELRRLGIPITEKTLATKATRGGGPQFFHFGRAVLYRRNDLLAWAEGRLSAPAASTAEADLNRHAA
jgi:hypothetical protein